MQYTVEGVLFALLGTYQLGMTATAIITDQDWQRAFGPNGVAFISIVAVVVLWLNSIKREKNEEARREKEEEQRDRRHSETLTLQKENSAKLMDLTAESIKSHAMSVGAIKSIDRTIMNLTEELKERPCQIGRAKP
jgi:heme exporter protein D